MNEENKNVLPVDFDGVFRFTNYTEEDFTAKWDSVEYTFPKTKTTPMIIPNASPVEVQSIRKKFAKELAVREFYKTPKFKGLDAHTPGGTPALYTESDLAPHIKRCLEPLPFASAKVQNAPKVDESIFKTDDDGSPVTTVIDGKLNGKKSLKGEGSSVVA